MNQARTTTAVADMLASVDHVTAQRSRAVPTRIVVARDNAGLDALAPFWNDLALRLPQRLPMLTLPWVASFLEHRLRSHQSWVCIAAFEANRMIGCLPLVVTPSLLFGQSRPRLRTSWDEHTPSGDMLLDPDHAHQAMIALLAAVRREFPGFLGLDLRGVRETSPTTYLARQGLDGFFVLMESAFKGAYFDLGIPSEKYWLSLSKNMRKNLKYTRGKLSKECSRVEFQVLTGDDASPGLLDEFLALEASGWKGRERTAIVHSARLTEFYRTLVRRLYDAGALEWHLLRADGRIIAMELSVRLGAAIATPKIAYDESFASCAPGYLLCEDTLRDAYARVGLEELNDVSEAPWQDRWQMNRHSYYSISLVPRDAVPAMARLPLIAGEKFLRHQVKPRLSERLLRPYTKLCRRLASR